MTPFGRALLRRTLTLLASSIVASLIVFAVTQVLPGDPARIALGLNASDEAVAQLRTEYGLDRPLPVQYLSWVGSMITFSFGSSYVTGAEIRPHLFDHLAVSLWLVTAGLLIALAIAIPAGTYAAIRRRHLDGAFVSALSQVGVAIPAFLAGILLTAVFAVRAQWLPSSGWVVPVDNPVEFLRHLTLPALSLGLVQGAVLTRYVRGAVVEVWREDYVRTARAKGITEGRIVARHTLRNSAIPLVTVLGVQLATLMVGAVVIERVFALPGLGSYLLDAVAARDLPVVQYVVMALVVLILLLNAVVDLLYGLIDPRVRSAS